MALRCEFDQETVLDAAIVKPSVGVQPDAERRLPTQTRD
jgi:hypothetical protein